MDFAPIHLVLLALAAIGQSEPRQEPIPDPEPLSQLRFSDDGPAWADRAFAARAAEAGTNEAFLDVFASEAALFRPQRVDGVTWMEANPDPGVLAWEPRAEAVSADGQLGATVGTFTYALGEQLLAGGHYVSVWTRDGEDPWQLVADIGVPHAVVPAPLPYARFALPKHPARADRAAVEESRAFLRDLEKTWAAEAAAGAENTSLDRCTDSRTLLLRPETAPVLGPDAAQCGVQRSWHRDRKVESGLSRILVAGSADLAVTWGDLGGIPAAEAIGDPEPTGAPRGGWLRVWRKDSAAGAWHVLAEVVLPVP